jgi:putative phosphoribosyl transferase
MFRDRTQVGKLLGERIRLLKIPNPIVLAIPRGGLPVAKEISLALEAPLDVIITRKIGAPSEPEYAVGAVSQEGEMIIDKEAVRSLAISEQYLKQECAKQSHEIKERMRKYRGDRPYPKLGGRTVIIVDDGIATGSTVLAAIKSVKMKKPLGIILATGVAPSDTVGKLSREVDRVVCLDTPEPFYAIGQFYEHFEQVEDEEAKGILNELYAKFS